MQKTRESGITRNHKTGFRQCVRDMARNASGVLPTVLLVASVPVTTAMWWSGAQGGALDWTARGLIIVVGLGLFQRLGDLRKRRTEEQRLYVAVARLNRKKDVLRETASDAERQLESALKAKADEPGTPLELIPLQLEITGTGTESERRDVTRRAAAPKAHVLIWGELNVVDGLTELTARVSIVKSPRDLETQEVQLCEQPPAFEPDHYDLVGPVSECTTLLADFISGFAYASTQQWHDALPIFAGIPVREARLFEGLCHVHAARGLDDPAAALEKAVEALDRARLSEEWNLDDPVQWSAFCNKAEALRMLGSMSPGHVSAELMEEVLRMYRRALLFRTKASSPREWAMALNNQGNALAELAGKVVGEEGIKLLGSAVSAFRAAVKVYTQGEMPEAWATTKNNLGVALRELGTRSLGEEGVGYLRESVMHLRSALQVRTRETLPRQWAMTHHHLGITLRRLARRDDSDLYRQHFRASIGSFRQALKIRTLEQCPLDWARTQHELATALTDYGTRLGGKRGREHLLEAVTTLRKVHNVRAIHADAVSGAATQVRLAASLMELAVRAGGDDAVRMLEDALEALEEALAVLTAQNVIHSRAEALHLQGRALFELGSRSRGMQSRGRIEAAVASYEAALEMLRRKEQPRVWAEVHSNLGTALASLGIRSAGRKGLGHLDRAVECLDQALEVFDVSTYPVEHGMTAGNKKETIRAKEMLTAQSRTGP